MPQSHYLLSLVPSATKGTASTTRSPAAPLTWPCEKGNIPRAINAPIFFQQASCLPRSMPVIPGQKLMLEHGFQAGMLSRRTPFQEMGFGLKLSCISSWNPSATPGAPWQRSILSEIHEGGIPFPPNPFHRAAINCSSTQKNPSKKLPCEHCNQPVQSIFTPRGQFCVAQCLLPPPAIPLTSQEMISRSCPSAGILESCHK